MYGVKVRGAQLIVLCIISLLEATFGCIYTHPQQVTGYAGERLSYICDANCGEKFWKVNSLFAIERMYPYEAVISRSGLRSILSVEASAATNNTLVTCLVSNPPNNVESSVTIIVQGTTAGPANLLFNYDENYVNLSWSRPYILPNTEVEFIVNVSTERNFSLFTTADTQLSFPYTMLDLDPCPLNQTVTISVAGINGAGEGEPSIIQPVITQLETEENCTQVVFPLGAPINVTVVVKNNSLIISWEPPSFTLPSDILGYTVRVNITASQDPLNSTTQSVSTNHTSFALPLSSLGIDTCDEEYHFAISVSAVDLTNRVGDSCLPIIEITSIELCPIATSATSAAGSSSVIWIVVGVTMAGVLTTLLAIVGVLTIIILLLLFLRRHRSKSVATYYHKRNSSMNENNAYGVALKSNGGYGCDSDEEPHIYEEIGVRKFDVPVATVC